MTADVTKLYIASLGCDKNLVDTEHMLGALDPARFAVTADEEAADVIIINTCCFIDEAKEESIGTILELAECKKTGACKALIVAGCMAERYRKEVLDELPEVDAVIGTGSFSRIEEAVDAVLGGGKGIYLDAPEQAFSSADSGDAVSADELFEMAAERTRKYARPRRIRTNGSAYAYLKIAEGCDKHCTYCIIPQLRGAYRSIPMEALLDEARELAAGGVRELILIAEETTCYGLDLYGEKSLHRLLEQLCAIEDLHWIRILYCYPEELYPEMIAVMKEQPKILPYLDLPVQHADDAVLRAMGRRTTQQELLDKIAYLRRELPGIVLRTTLISGFPGETEEQHETLLSFVRNVQFDRLGVFAYSQEEGTPAATLPGQVPEEVRRARRDAILEIQQDISLANGQKRVGTTMEVQIDGFLPEEQVYVGRTAADTPDVDGYCFVRSPEVLESGTFISAVVTGATAYDLTADFVEVLLRP